MPVTNSVALHELGLEGTRATLHTGIMTTLIRRATIEDAARLSQLGARTFRDTFEADNTSEHMEIGRAHV